MYHAHLRGTHREAGFRWGSLLLKHKNILTGHIPFDITAERMEYAMACEPIYRRYYPEIQGLSEGQQCDGQVLKTVLFSMYAIPDGENALLGRNSDFLTELEKLNMSTSTAWRPASQPWPPLCASPASMQDSSCGTCWKNAGRSPRPSPP